jgi:signal transduction histidine kinase
MQVIVMPTTTPGNGAATPARSAARVREAMARVGIHVRDRVSEPLDSILLSAQRILSDPSVSEQLHQTALDILGSAERIAYELGDIEDSASAAFATDPLFSRPPQAPQPLTSALAGELTHLARQADTPLKSPQVALLKPRLKRAARLANLWLSTTIDIEATGGGAPRTSTLGPAGEVVGNRTTVVRRPETRLPARSSASPAAPLVEQNPTVTTAARALADRLERLKAQHIELQARYDAREAHWRGAIHEIRNAAQAFVSWCHMLRHSEVTATPWFAPLRKAAEALQRRAEEAAARKPADTENIEIQISSFDIVAVARGALDLIRPMADAAGVTLAISAPMRAEPIAVSADPDKVEQILHNLLRNGIEATPTGGTISIAIGANDQHAEVEVEDSGAGISDDLIGSLFSGAPSSSSDKQGFGVGLMLSHELATRMSCDLEVRSRLAGNGACFVLRLPRAS